MKRILLPSSLPALAAAVLAMAGVSCREEAGTTETTAEGTADGTTYVMEMKGMVCGGCMMEVKDALAKVDDVPDEAVEFKRGSRPETKRVVFTAKSAALTREQVNEALGEASERLVIESFAVEKGS